MTLILDSGDSGESYYNLGVFFAAVLDDFYKVLFAIYSVPSLLGTGL